MTLILVTYPCFVQLYNFDDGDRVDILLIAGTKSKSVGETETMHRQVREGHKININKSER